MMTFFIIGVNCCQLTSIEVTGNVNCALDDPPKLQDWNKHRVPHRICNYSCLMSSELCAISSFRLAYVAVGLVVFDSILKLFPTCTRRPSFLLTTRFGRNFIAFSVAKLETPVLSVQEKESSFLIFA